ncbi:MAG TPA: sigma-70 family RNA polymerase sigma factor [Schlesneria sp.]|jgi:RNA polymerase sigma factor (sigma-70 family)
MITALQIDEFVSEVQHWRKLATTEQDDVIGEALDRYLAKQMEFDESGATLHSKAQIDNPVGWLLRCARLITFELRRHRDNEREMFIEYCGGMYQDRRVNGKAMHVEATWSDSEIDFDAARTSQLSVCNQALQSLTPDEQQVANLCFIEELMPAEVGRIMSTSRSTTKARRERIRRKLQSNPMLRQLVNSVQPTISPQ